MVLKSRLARPEVGNGMIAMVYTYEHDGFSSTTWRVWADGDRYEGDFRDGNRHGHGVYVGANGDRYEGD